jgi:hypothetical protein
MHPSAWKGFSPKSAYSVLHKLNDEERKERAEPKIEVMPVRAPDPGQTA